MCSSRARIVHVLDRLTATSGGVAAAVAQLIGDGCDPVYRHEIITVHDDAALVATPVPVAAAVATRIGGRWRYSSGTAGALRDSFAGAHAVHVHGIWTHPQLCAMAVAARSGVPVVLTPHNMLGGWLWWNGGYLRLARKWMYWEVMARRHFQTATVIHVLSLAEERQIRKYFPRHRVATIPNGIDVDGVRAEAQSNWAELTNSAYDFLLFVGRLHPVKGLEAVLRGMSRLPREKRVKLIVAGPASSERYRRSLRSMVGALDLTQWVEFTDGVFGADKLRLMRSAKAVVAPSLSEGISMVALEAMACGTPVITTRQSGIDGVEDGGGALIEPDDWSITYALQGVHGWSTEERLARGAAAFDLVRSRYDRAVVWPQFAKLYASLR